jgi:hypothetical protein
VYPLRPTVPHTCRPLEAGGLEPRHGEARPRSCPPRPAPAHRSAPRARRIARGRRQHDLVRRAPSRAAELEAQLLAEERAAENARARSQPRAKSIGRSAPSSLELKEEVEYAYVVRDVRDIVRIAALLFAVLFGLWIVIDKLRILPIG